MIDISSLLVLSVLDIRLIWWLLSFHFDLISYLKIKLELFGHWVKFRRCSWAFVLFEACDVRLVVQNDDRYDLRARNCTRLGFVGEQSKVMLTNWPISTLRPQFTNHTLILDTIWSEYYTQTLRIFIEHSNLPLLNFQSKWTFEILDRSLVLSIYFNTMMIDVPLIRMIQILKYMKQISKHSNYSTKN